MYNPAHPGKLIQEYLNGLKEEGTAISLAQLAAHHDSFYIGNDQFKVKDKQVWIPNLGWVKTKEAFKYQGSKINNAVISRQADRWFVSIR